MSYYTTKKTTLELTSTPHVTALRLVVFEHEVSMKCKITFSQKTL